MAKRITKQRRADTIKLADFATERMIMADSPHWRTIAEWQRRGLVALRWEDSRNFAFVRLTDKGVLEAGSGRVILA